MPGREQEPSQKSPETKFTEAQQTLVSHVEEVNRKMRENTRFMRSDSDPAAHVARGIQLEGRRAIATTDIIWMGLLKKRGIPAEEILETLKEKESIQNSIDAEKLRKRNGL